MFKLRKQQDNPRIVLKDGILKKEDIFAKRKPNGKYHEPWKIALLEPECKEIGPYGYSDYLGATVAVPRTSSLFSASTHYVKRAVVAVNACQGLSNEALEDDVIKEMIDYLKKIENKDETVLNILIKLERK
jgi:hypothetical protein